MLVVSVLARMPKTCLKLMSYFNLSFFHFLIIFPLHRRSGLKMLDSTRCISLYFCLSIPFVIAVIFSPCQTFPSFSISLPHLCSAFQHSKEINFSARVQINVHSEPTKGATSFCDTSVVFFSHHSYSLHGFSPQCPFDL